MILTQEFLDKCNVCIEGQECADNGGYIGWDYDEVIKDLVSKNDNLNAGWLIDAKKSEQYVRANGSIITMGAYQLFNPITGLHTRYETEEDVKIALIALQQEVLNIYGGKVVQELSNENGDTTWIPTEIHKTIVVS